MDKPIPEKLLATLREGERFTIKGNGAPAKAQPVSEPTVLAPEDEAYPSKLIAGIRAGKHAVIIVEDSDDKLKYMFSNASRAEAVSMLGKVIEATGRHMSRGDD